MYQINDIDRQGRRLVAEAENHLLRSGQASDRVQVLGHRGAPVPGIAENSVAAVTRALRQGADGVEIDVWLVANGTLVCTHDLADADVNSLATLTELLAAAQGPEGTRVVVEAKPVADPAVAQATADALADVLRTSAGTAGITISSFDADLLATIRATCADLPVRTALLGEKSDDAAAVVRRASRDGHDEVHLSLVAAGRTPRAVRVARALGLGVSLWTVNAARDLRWAAGLGVDAVITDDVRTARNELSRPAVGDLAQAAA
ncbi:MAG: glycerophosphoryl diester phosphodiesterase [Blastococcus sp.]|jgi:glycerophosphoryl diester phosphodiesterase|nr:glycerophosphoryl diester phosphodiesterase [Blastococcus sp.]